jgi:hypothetical protein
MASSSATSSSSESEAVISLHPLDTSMETDPPSPQDVSQEPEPRILDGENPERSADDTATNPERSADIPTEPSHYVSRERTYYSGLALSLAQNRAIHHWFGPSHPDHATSTTRLHSFSNAKWSTKGKPSRESLVDAGFYYDGESQIFNFGGLFKLPKYPYLTALIANIRYSPSLIPGWSDMCLCFHCSGALIDWKSTDDPWVEHARYFPYCVYLNYIKEHAFVQHHHPEWRTEVD